MKPQAPRLNPKAPAAPAKSARKPRPKPPAVKESPGDRRDRLFHSLREELGL